MVSRFYECVIGFLVYPGQPAQSTLVSNAAHGPLRQTLGVPLQTRVDMDLYRQQMYTNFINNYPHVFKALNVSPNHNKPATTSQSGGPRLPNSYTYLTGPGTASGSTLTPAHGAARNSARSESNSARGSNNPYARPITADDVASPHSIIPPKLANFRQFGSNNSINSSSSLGSAHSVGAPVVTSPAHSAATSPHTNTVMPSINKTGHIQTNSFMRPLTEKTTDGKPPTDTATLIKYSKRSESKSAPESKRPPSGPNGHKPRSVFSRPDMSEKRSTHDRTAAEPLGHMTGKAIKIPVRGEETRVLSRRSSEPAPQRASSGSQLHHRIDPGDSAPSGFVVETKSHYGSQSRVAKLGRSEAKNSNGATASNLKQRPPAPAPAAAQNTNESLSAARAKFQQSFLKQTAQQIKQTLQQQQQQQQPSSQAPVMHAPPVSRFSVFTSSSQTGATPQQTQSAPTGGRENARLDQRGSSKASLKSNSSQSGSNNSWVMSRQGSTVTFRLAKDSNSASAATASPRGSATDTPKPPPSTPAMPMTSAGRASATGRLFRSNSIGSTSSEASSILGASAQSRVRNPHYTPSRPYAQVSSPSGDGSSTTMVAATSGLSGASSRSSCATPQAKQLQKFHSDTTSASSASQIYIQTTSRDLKTRSQQAANQSSTSTGTTSSCTTTGSGSGSGSQSDHESERRTEALNNRLGAFKRNSSFSCTQSAVEINPQMLLDGRIKEMPVTHTLTGPCPILLLS